MLACYGRINKLVNESETSRHSHYDVVTSFFKSKDEL